MVKLVGEYVGELSQGGQRERLGAPWYGRELRREPGGSGIKQVLVLTHRLAQKVEPRPLRWE